MVPDKEPATAVGSVISLPVLAGVAVCQVTTVPGGVLQGECEVRLYFVPGQIYAVVVIEF